MCRSEGLLSTRFCRHHHQTANFVQWKERYTTLKLKFPKNNLILFLKDSLIVCNVRIEPATQETWNSFIILLFHQRQTKACCWLQDQMRALDMIQNDPELSSLRIIESPLVDVEIRGVPALRFMGDMVWKWTYQP